MFRFSNLLEPCLKQTFEFFEVVFEPVFIWGFDVFDNGRGETLTSISQLYGVPILDNCWLAAADKDAVDLDSVSGGQRRNIPSAIATGYAQLVSYFTCM